MTTYHGSVERSSQEKVIDDSNRINAEEFIVQLAEASNTMFLILNKHRQIVLANKKVLALLNSDIKDIIGKRPGEALDCTNAKRMKAGCGTSAFCKECGAVNAILSALEGEEKENECRITSSIDNKKVAYDLLVKAQPFFYNDEKYVLFSVIDISGQKRREILERTFFHDVLNTAGGVYGHSRFLKEILKDAGNEFYESAEIIYNLSDSLVSEIKAQQQLLAAESNTLEIDTREMVLEEYVSSVVRSFGTNIEYSDVKIVIEECDELVFESDAVLLNRVLTNMIKNAAEASNSNQLVSVKAIQVNDRIRFSVHNQSFIEEIVQHQIFLRSFSTKGKDRGIGTYSMKLFGEDYLQGNVWFESNKTDGTTFYLEIPLTISGKE